MPQKLENYFWDINTKKIDIVNDYIFIISRIFEVGELDSLKWVFKTYSKGNINEALNSRNVSKETREFICAIISE